ncbi:MAG: GDYXXLXY domain-containing protein [Carboxydocellales bacterium]
MEYQLNQLPYDWLNEVVKTVEKCLVVVDQEGLICYINPGYCEFLGVSAEAALGKRVQEVSLAAMTIQPLMTLFAGQEIKLKTQPVDPTDLFRGDYGS